MIHFPNCTANYPEKVDGEAPQALQEIGGGVFVCVDCGAFENPAPRSLRDRRLAGISEMLLAASEHEEAPAEVERLRADLRHQAALWQTALGHAAEQDAEIKSLTGEVKALREQRDALADALESIRPRLRRWRASGIQVGSAGRDLDFEDLVAAIEAALRTVGR